MSSWVNGMIVRMVVAASLHHDSCITVSINWGPFCGSLYNKSPIILGSLLGPLIF